MTQTDEFPFVGQGLLNRFLAMIRCGRDRGLWVHRRIFLSVLITWVPLLFFCLRDGTAWGPRVQAPLLRDPAGLVRFLISLPLLFIAEAVIGRELKTAMRYFEESGIVRDEELDDLGRLVKNAHGLLNSVVLDFIIIVLVVISAVGHFDVAGGAGAGVTTWQWNIDTHSLSAAGLWYRYVSCSVFRLIAYMWFWRYAVWTWLLWRLSKLNLNLMPTHPDLAGGLGILEESQMSFGVVVLALSAHVAGYVARTILYDGATVKSNQIFIATTIAALMVFFITPLFVFSGKLFSCRQWGLKAYGSLAEKYSDLFGKKWLGMKGKNYEEFLGTSDIQSLADMAGSYQIVTSMRMFPFGQRILIFLAGAAVIPFLPLVLFVYKPDQLLVRLFLLVF